MNRSFIGIAIGCVVAGLWIGSTLARARSVQPAARSQVPVREGVPVEYTSQETSGLEELSAYVRAWRETARAEVLADQVAGARALRDIEVSRTQQPTIAATASGWVVLEDAAQIPARGSELAQELVKGGTEITTEQIKMGPAVIDGLVTLGGKAIDAGAAIATKQIPVSTPQAGKDPKQQKEKKSEKPNGGSTQPRRPVSGTMEI